MPRNKTILRRVLVQCFYSAVMLAIAYVAFVSVICVLVGFQHLHQSGFWAPIFTGGAALFILSMLLLRTIRGMLRGGRQNPLDI